MIDPASVIGLGFAVDALVHLVPEDAMPEVPVRLQALTSKQFIRPTVAEADFYRFGHSVIKDSAYRSLLKRTRADLHERFVDWADPINRERGRELEFEEILGYHLEQAYRYRVELGSVDDAGGIGERAAIKLSSAGQRALARGDIPAAVNLLRRSIALLPATSAFRLELMVDLGDANLQQGDFDAAANVLDETIAIADEAGQERYAVRAAVLKAAVDQFRVGGEGGQSRAMEVATRSIAALERLEDAAGLARAWRLVMYAEGNQGHVDEASAAAARVIEYAGQAGDRRLASRSAPPIVAFLLHGPATVAAAVARCEELLDITQGDRKVEAVIVSTLAVLRAMEGRFDEARALYRRGQATLAELGTGIDAHSTSIDSARVERLAGDPRTAELELRRDYSALEAIGESYLRSTVAASLAEVLFLNGDLVGANAYSEITEQIADPDDVEPQVKWRMVRARVLAASDAAVSAVRLATEGVNLASATSDHLLRADALTDLGDVFLVVGDPESSGPPLREALELYERKGDVVSAGRLRERIGVAAAG